MIINQNGAAWVLLGDKRTFDADSDGLVSWEEYAIGTNPRDFDTNHNGLSDGLEVALGYSPTSNDSDGDGLSNAYELAIGTDPFNADTDHDGVPDGIDAFPNNPNASAWPAPSPTDITPPVITITAPAGVIKL